MSNEIGHWHDVSGETLYAFVLDALNRVWNGSAFETVDLANWATYDIALAETPADSRYWVGDFPGAIPTGVYEVVVYLQAAGAPASTDNVLGSGRMEWDGTAEVRPPTKAEMDAGHALLATPADVHTTVLPGQGQRIAARRGADFILAEASDETVPWHVLERDGSDLDLSSYASLKFQVYDAAGTLVFELTTGEGITVTDAEGGQVTLTFTAAQLAEAARHRYEFWGFATGVQTALVQGGFVIEGTHGPGDS